MATIEKNVLMLKKEGLDIIIEYPATKYDNILDLPSAFPPKTHTHTKSQITDFPISLKNPVALKVQLNGGTTEGTNQFTYDGSVAKAVNITPASIGASPSGHNHSGVYEPAFTKNNAFNKAFGTAAGTVCQGNDARLSDARTPKAHTHTKSQVTDFPASLKNPTALKVQLNGGTTEGTNQFSYDGSVAKSLNVTPASIGASPSGHNHSGVYEPVFTKNNAFNKAFGTGAGTVCQGNDARLSDARPASDVYSWAKQSAKPTYTKAEVGLGNVPNVTTNDQTPTYTDTTTLATLSSGEKLSVAFAKIKLAITNLINHIANKSNPHGVTKAQVGLGNVDNTSDANKPVSAAMLSALNGKAASNHNHSGVYEPVFTKNNAFNKAFGTGAGTVCQGNDARLSDARTPKAHTHTKSQVTDFPASLKNPTALTLKLNGESQTYDGSVARTFDVEVSNPNLLINGDFQVWQRGVTFAINKSKMITVDRWCAIYDTAPYTVKKDDLGRLQITPPSSGKCGIYQRVELNSSIISSLKGNRYTLSFHVLSTKEFSLTSSVNILKNDGTSVLLGKIEKLIDANVTTKVKYTFSIPSNANFDNYNSLQVILLNDYSIPANVYFSKAKLEIGENSTYYMPKSYAEELLMCQRYYAYLRDIYVGRYWTNAYLGLYFPVEMRVNPTVKYQKVMSATWVDVSSQTTMNDRIDKRGFRSVTTTSEDGPLLTIQYLELDAEIY